MRDRYHQSTKQQDAVTYRRLMAQRDLQRWTVETTITRAFELRDKKRGTPLGAELIALAEAEGLRWRNGWLQRMQ